MQIYLFGLLFVLIKADHDELFEMGSVVDPQFQTRHLSSSTEDLVKLFEAECVLVNQIRKASDLKPNVMKVINGFLDAIDYDETQETFEYVFHPINAYNLIKRTTKWYSKLNKAWPNFVYPLHPNLLDAKIGSAHGISAIREFYDLNPAEIVKGQLKDHLTGKIFQARSNLTLTDVLHIAEAAKEGEFYESCVLWHQLAVELATNKKPMKKLLKKAKELHDLKYNGINFLGQITSNMGIRHEPYDGQDEDTVHQKGLIFQALQNYEQSYEENLYPPGITKMSKQWKAQSMNNGLGIILRPRIQQLCRGTFTRPAKLDKKLKCFWLTQANPYLKLGPFKYETLNAKPDVGLIHDMFDETELERVKSQSRGRMKTTPYMQKGSAKDYSTSRTSKVFYLNEIYVQDAMTLSKRIQLATKFKLKDDKYGSENYQVMNYGMGGRISGHVDSVNSDDDQNSMSEWLKFGGVRFMTFMIYMSTVESGGRTLFPQLGISVQPRLGDALFWFNVGSKFTYDSRAYHLGCPVLYGNKWIANKWVKILAQFSQYPCSVEADDFHFSIYKE